MTGPVTTYLPGKAFMVVGALALAGIVAGAVAGAREPVAQIAVLPSPVFVDRFDAPDDFPLMKKSDRLPLPGPIPVKTETIATVQPQDKVEDKKPKPKKTEPTKVAEREVEQDVCTRHHMHRVSIRHGRSWRCRK